MVKLETLSECQCCGSSRFIGIDMAPKNDPYHASLGLTEAFGWSLCLNCSFVFQNPRLPRQFQEQYYSDSCYRKFEPTIITEGYKSFAPQQLVRFDLWLQRAGVNLRNLIHGTCLDYGCGIGAALAFLAAGNNRCYGVELDRVLMEFGNANYPVTIVPRASDLPPQLQYDLIFTHNAVEHVYDPNDFFSYASMHLKPTGRIVFVVPAWRNSNTMHTIGEFNMCHNSMWDHVALARFANKHGLFLSSFTYGNPAPDGDWEICAILEKSNRKNYFSFSVEEILQELYVNIPSRAMAREQSLPLRAEHVAYVG